jgi:hypothetical protein
MRFRLSSFEDGKWHIKTLRWHPWWRLDIPVRVAYFAWEANRKPPVKLP